MKSFELHPFRFITHFFRFFSKNFRFDTFFDLEHYEASYFCNFKRLNYQDV